jgi:hypothetical protein
MHVPTAGDGFVIKVDAARFLPCNCTITKVRKRWA